MSAPSKTSLLEGNGTTAFRLEVVAREIKEGHALSSKLRTCNYDGRIVSVIKSLLAAIGISIERTNAKAVSAKLEVFVRESQHLLLGPQNTSNRENCQIILDKLLLPLKDKKSKQRYQECIRILKCVPEKPSTSETPTQKEPTPVPQQPPATQNTDNKESPSVQDHAQLKDDLPNYSKQLLHAYTLNKGDYLSNEDSAIAMKILTLAIQSESTEAIKNIIQLGLELPNLSQRELLSSGARRAIQLDKPQFFKEFDCLAGKSYPLWAHETDEHKIIKEIWDLTIQHKSLNILNYLIDQKYFICGLGKSGILFFLCKRPFEEFKLFAEPIIRKAPELLGVSDLCAGSLTSYLIVSDKKETLKWLLETFDGLPFVDFDGITALSLAVEGKDSELAEILIRKDTKGLAWKNNKSCGIAGITDSDTVEEVVEKMKNQIGEKV